MKLIMLASFDLSICSITKGMARRVPLFKKASFMVVGGATFPYLELLLPWVNQYVVIDPLVKLEMLPDSIYMGTIGKLF